MKTEAEKKEANRIACKKYNDANKEKTAAYYQANKARFKDYGESLKDGLFTVYLLPKENYVGMTNCLSKRLSTHKTRQNRDITGVWILGKYETKREALDIEAEYHASGFKGKHIKAAIYG